MVSKGMVIRNDEGRKARLLKGKIVGEDDDVERLSCQKRWKSEMTDAGMVKSEMTEIEKTKVREKMMGWWTSGREEKLDVTVTIKRKVMIA